jgi:hypothetical protein
MGNITNGLKIRKIGEKSLLKEITYGYDERIAEFVCFVIKINDRPFDEKYQEIQAKTNYIVHNFSIFNILTKKEYKIKLESTNNKIFFLDLEVEFAQIPNLERVLLISNVIENSVATSLKLKPNVYILIGREDLYVQEMEQISSSIEEFKAKFIFFNFSKKKSKILDFEALRSKDNEFKLGIECEVLSIENFIRDCFNKINANSLVQTDFLNPGMQEPDKEIENSAKDASQDESTSAMILESEIQPLEIIKITSNSQTTIRENSQQSPQAFHDNINTIEEGYIKEERENLTLEEDILVENTMESLNSIFKYSLKRPKARLKKNLQIYKNLDSHFNLLGTNYKKETSDSVSNNQKSVILIKGFSLLNIDEGQASNSILAITKLYNNSLYH